MQNKNRRKFIRLSAYHLVKYKPLSSKEGESFPILAVIRDIGAGGVCLRAEEPLAVSSVIELKINFPNVSTAISALAKIVWVKKRKSYYEVGAEFVEISDSLQTAIDQKVCNVTKTVEKKRLLSFLFRRT